jgi:hypothetical protein
VLDRWVWCEVGDTGVPIVQFIIISRLYCAVAPTGNAIVVGLSDQVWVFWSALWTPVQSPVAECAAMGSLAPQLQCSGKTEQEHVATY